MGGTSGAWWKGTAAPTATPPARFADRSPSRVGRIYATATRSRDRQPRLQRRRQRPDDRAADAVPEGREQEQGRADHEGGERDVELDRAELAEQADQSEQHVGQRRDEQGAPVDRQRGQAEQDIDARARPGPRRSWRRRRSGRAARRSGGRSAAPPADAARRRRPSGGSRGAVGRIPPHREQEHAEAEDQGAGRA